MKSSFCVAIRHVLVLSLLSVRIAASDDTSGSVYKPDVGPFQVQSIKRVVVEDTKRNKELQLRINYPAENGLFPVIVWSHGAGGSKDNYLPLTEYWASHGYVTIQPTHSDSRSLAAKRGVQK
jgi:predicted dienelactone hydrolase